MLDNVKAFCSCEISVKFQNYNTASSVWNGFTFKYF